MFGPVLALGAVTWLVTTIVVESEIFRPLREWVGQRFGEESKLAYLAHCHLCAGTWVGLLVAAASPYRPLASTLPLGGILLAGLLYKAIAHLILAINNTLRRFS